MVHVPTRGLLAPRSTCSWIMRASAANFSLPMTPPLLILDACRRAFHARFQGQSGRQEVDRPALLPGAPDRVRKLHVLHAVRERRQRHRLAEADGVNEVRLHPPAAGQRGFRAPAGGGAAPPAPPPPVPP